MELLSKHRGNSKLLAGGQSLIPLMKLRLASPQHLVDINRLQGLDYIRKEGDFVKIGALTRMAEVEKSELLGSILPAMTECATQVADPLVRNLGTIGGNIAHGDPANDLPAVALATDAELVIEGPSGLRTVKATDFFLDTFVTALREDEILTEVRIPLLGRNSASAYVKLERQAGDFAIVGVAVQLGLGEGGRCSACGIGLTAVGATALRARKAESVLIGKKIDKESVSMASSVAAEESNPASDLRGSAEYKRKMVKVVVARAIMRAVNRIGVRD